METLQKTNIAVGRLLIPIPISSDFKHSPFFVSTSMLYIFPTLLIKISYKWFIFHFETGFPPAPQSNKGSQSERMANDLIWPQYTQPPQTLCKLTKYSPLQRGAVCQIPQLWHSPFIHCAKRSTIFYVFLFIFLYYSIALLKRQTFALLKQFGRQRQ